MRPHPFCKLLRVVLALLPLLGGEVIAQTPNADNLSLTTRDRLEDPGWWPRKGDAPGNQYIGVAACGACHAALAASQPATPMSRAAARASQPEVLKTHARLNFAEGSYGYSLTRDGSAAGILYSVNDAAHSMTAPLDWAFGAGEIGQTFLLSRDNTFIEARVSYYTLVGALDVTTGQPPDPPATLDKGWGRTLDIATTRQCFSCHTTEAVTANTFQPEKATPGLTCEACHGPGARHVAAVTSGTAEMAKSIFNPKQLSPSDSVDFCGACHRTWADVAMEMPANVGTVSVRFQPYRLEKSRCWGTSGDRRVTCVACHDPHQPLAHEAQSYDSKCLACHMAKGETKPASAPACKVGANHCVSCHMPKYEVAQTHARFTDHYIRVVRNGALYPP